MNNKRTYKMVVLSLLVAIEFVLATTPLGYVPIGAIRATTLHIPVILAGMLLGYKGGLFLGFIFGFTSLISNTFTPTPASFLFTPFFSGGKLASLLICFIPRMSIGLVSAGIYKLIKNKIIIVPIASLLASLTNTCLVLGGIYLFFKDSYAALKNVNAEAVAGLLLAQLSINGVIEAILAALLCSALVAVLKKIIRK